MGLFNNYNKPGKGVSKDEKQKTGIARFFELYIRKFWNICILNILIVLFTIPFVAISVSIFKLIGIGNLALLENLQLRLLISLVPFAFFGPILAGGLKITRDFVREEPGFMWNDFVSSIKKNFKQTVVFSIISYIGVAAFSYAIPAYYHIEGFTKYILFPATMIAALIFLFAHYYYYIMAITCKLTVKQLIKNSVILALACFLRNMLLTIIVGALVIGLGLMVLYGIATPILIAIVIMLVVFFAIGFILYTISFLSFPAIKKFIIDPYYEQNPEETLQKSDSNDIQNNDVGDDGDAKITEPKSEYVYHNGRMIHRSVLEEDALFDDSLNIGIRKDD